ncbi:MAG: hypothetical protein K2V38_26320, partial [Gemmataceae bacterium]|nr:hypothetical protein [Gemmataceae bacterium]
SAAPEGCHHLPTPPTLANLKPEIALQRHTLRKEKTLIEEMEAATGVKGPKLLPVVSGVDYRYLPKQ